MDWIRAHRKGLLAALTGVLLLVLDQESADKIAGAAGVLLILLVPNNQEAATRIYRRRRQ
jgi:hypothetical protein